MNTELIGVVITFLVTVVLAFPLGRYIAKVFKGERTIMDFLSPSKLIFRICGIDPTKKMNWKEFLKAMLTINSCGSCMLLYVHFPRQAAAEPGRQSEHDAGPGIQYSAISFHHQY
jgi:K+-transporting ATPase A subunit